METILAFLLLCIPLSWTLAIRENIVEGPLLILGMSHLTGKELADYVNRNQKLFEAESNGKEELYHRKIMDLKFVGRGPAQAEEYSSEELNDTDIPESFDARIRWPECPSLRNIRDQANCGSCWAFSSTEAMSDRLCIASGGKKKVLLSADDVLACCETCRTGCEGGYPIKAWLYFVEKGICSGDPYGDKNVCKPYEIAPCGHHKNETFYHDCNGYTYPPKCVQKCQDGYQVSYKDDKVFGKTAYYLPRSVSEIQRDLMKNGPVVAVFTIYEDFMQYKSGIYKHTAGAAKGGHVVKVLGWGSENGVPYWIMANSWNTDWGENGFFRIVRGDNECGIEDYVNGGLV